MDSVINDRQENVVLSLKNVSVKYRLKNIEYKGNKYYQAVRNVSFDVFRGETLGITGRNGAGKSTLLKIMAGIIVPDEGSVYNNNVSVSLLSLHAGFDSELTGRDNAIISGMLTGYSLRQIKYRMDDIIEFSGLGEFIDMPVKTYSSGMKSRLGFSVSMFLTPDVLLLDEILSVGDKEFKMKAEAEMVKKIHSEQTIILVSHSDHQVNRLCDRRIEL